MLRGFLLLLITVSQSYAYHTTNVLLKQIEQLCSETPYCHTPAPSHIFIHGNDPHTALNMFVFGEHARELISSEIGLELVRTLSTRRPTKSYLIIPVLNDWGRRRAETVNPCLRVNENGVDLNRNYPTQGKRDMKPGNTYAGPYPFSEKETRMVKHLLETHSVHTFVSIHSGDLAMYLPWDGSIHTPPHYQTAMHKVNVLKRRFCPKCVVGPAAKVSSYKCYGTAVDYVMEYNLAQYAFTFEVWNSSSGDCFKRFNPIETAETVKQWVSILRNI